MRIKELIVKNFGKIKDKNVALYDGVNLLYGENESGKSTLHTFIKCMLFGLERGRGRASVNDTFSTYEPWENPNYYSGILKFESGGKSFCLSRNFDRYSRSAELICEDDGEELSVADGDLEMILGGLTRAVYDNTVSVGQLKAEPGQTLAAELKNYASNYYAAGSSDINLEKASGALRARLREQEREAKEALEEKHRKREKIELEASYVWRDVHRLEGERERIGEELESRRKKERERQEEPENKGVIDELRPNKWRIHPVEIVLFAVVVVFAFALIPKPWNYLVAIILFLLCGIYVWNRMKVDKRTVKTEPEIILEEITPEEEKIPLEKLRWEMNHVCEELREKQVQYDNLREQLEELDEVNSMSREQERNIQGVRLAMERLSELAAGMQKELEQKLDDRASEIMSEITGGRYTKLVVEDDLHMNLICGGRKIPVEQVSRGTIEQTYFALRMASAGLLHEEEYPVILDDTFVYYDDARLENTLRWLAENKKQVIIFTCQKREEHILDELGIKYRKL